MQNQHNGIENDDDVEFLLAHIKKVQNIAKVETLVSDKIAPLIKGKVGKKGVDVSIRKVICTSS